MAGNCWSSPSAVFGTRIRLSINRNKETRFAEVNPSEGTVDYGNRAFQPCFLLFYFFVVFFAACGPKFIGAQSDHFFKEPGKMLGIFKAQFKSDLIN